MNARGSNHSNLGITHSFLVTRQIMDKYGGWCGSIEFPLLHKGTVLHAFAQCIMLKSKLHQIEGGM